MIRTLLQVRIAGHGHYKVEMAVHELLALAGNYLLYTFYVFWLLGLGMLACRFFFLSSSDSSRFWLGRKMTWL